MMDQEVMLYITGKALSNYKALQRFKGLLHTNEQNNAFGTYGVYGKKDHQFYGIAKFVPNNDHSKEVLEIGYALLKDYWGQGYATEITLALINLAKSIEGLETLEALVSPRNAPSKRILEKCHFIFYGKTYSYDSETEIYRLSLTSGQKQEWEQENFI